jgi:hypothetical protein
MKHYTCSRCGFTASDDIVAPALALVDGRYSIEVRCRVRAACASRKRARPEQTELLG